VRFLTQGFIYCVIAAFGFSGVNICLRSLTVRCDRVWVLLIKEAITFVAIAVWARLGGRLDGRVLPGWRTIAVLTTIGALTHLLGTLPWLWSLAEVGLAVAVPLSLCTSLVTTAALGRWVLEERVSGRSLVAMGLLLGAVGVLTSGTQAPPDRLASAVAALGSWTLWLATSAACMAGIIYGVLNIAVRHSVTRGVSLVFVALVGPVMGVVCLGPVCAWRAAWEGFPPFSQYDLLLLAAGGMLNAVAWFAFVKSLQSIAAVHANLVTASQVGIAALAGVCLFGEALSPAVITGVAMTALGIVCIDPSSS